MEEEVMVSPNPAWMGQSMDVWLAACSEEWFLLNSPPFYLSTPT